MIASSVCLQPSTCDTFFEHYRTKDALTHLSDPSMPLQVFAGLVTRDHLLVLLRQALSQPQAAGKPAAVPYEALRRNPLADRRRAAALDPLLHILQVRTCLCKSTADSPFGIILLARRHVLCICMTKDGNIP